MKSSNYWKNFIFLVVFLSFNSFFSCKSSKQFTKLEDLTNRGLTAVENDPSGAYKYLKKAKKLAKRFGEKQLTNVLNEHIGTAYFNSYDFENAISYHQKSIATIDSSENLSSRYLKLALDHHFIAELYQAQFYYEKALINAKTEVDKIYANIKLGGLFRHLNQFDNSLVHYQKGLEIINNSSNQSLEKQRGYIYSELGVLYAFLNESTKAHLCYEKALQSNFNQEERLNTQINKGILYLRDLDYTNARNLFEAITFKSNETSLYHVLATLYIGDIYFFEKDFISAESFYQKVLERLDKKVNPVLKHSISIRLAHIEIENKNLKIANRHLQQLISFIEKNKYQDIELSVQAYLTLGILRENEGLIEQAFEHYLQAIRLIEDSRKQIFDKNIRQLFFQNRVLAYEKIIDLAYNLKHNKVSPTLLKWGSTYAKIAFRFSEKLKYRILSEKLVERQLQSSTILSSSKRNQTSVNSKINILQKRLNDIYFSDQFTSIQNQEEITNIQNELSSFIERKSIENKHYETLENIEFVELSKAPLFENEIVIEYEITEDNLFTFIIKNHQLLDFIKTPIRRDSLDTLIKNLRHSINLINYIPDSLFLDTELTSKLYDVLLTPIDKWLTKKTNIIIIADESLLKLPFEILPALNKNADILFLVQDDSLTISYYPSLAALNLMRTNRENNFHNKNQKILLIGDPIPQQDPCFNFNRLINSRKEILSIASEFGIHEHSAHVKLDMNATKDFIKNTDLSQYQFIHFATHSYLGTDHPQCFSQPGLMLSRSDDAINPPYLNMQEILNLDLQADLVTLSACQTGLGRKINGEGVIGLSRAFLYAGSKSVMVSLWAIDDASTSEFMRFFYKNLIQGKNRAEALSKAKRDMINYSYHYDENGQVYYHKNPFFWASFILIGEYN